MAITSIRAMTVEEKSAFDQGAFDFREGYVMNKSQYLVRELQLAYESGYQLHIGTAEHDVD